MKRLLIILLTILTISTTSVTAYARPEEVIDNIVILHIWEVSEEFDLDFYVLASLVYQESRFIVEDNLTQITNKKWFREGIEYTGNDDITNPYNNIRICGYYLNKWLQDHEIEECLAMWNTGHFAQTSKYSREIIRRADKWRERIVVNVDVGSIPTLKLLYTTD